MVANLLSMYSYGHREVLIKTLEITAEPIRGDNILVTF